MKDDVYLNIYARISGWVPEDKIILPEDRFEDLGLDSIDMLELVMWSEEEFGIEINDAEFYKADVETVGAFASFIESQMEKEG